MGVPYILWHMRIFYMFLKYLASQLIFIIIKKSITSSTYLYVEGHILREKLLLTSGLKKTPTSNVGEQTVITEC